MFSAILLAMSLQTVPYNLLVVSDQGGVALSNYASIWRCEKARDAIQKLGTVDVVTPPPRSAPRRRQKTDVSPKLQAYCIPG